MNNLASALTGIHGERVALSDVSVSAVLRDLLAEVTVAANPARDKSSKSAPSGITTSSERLPSGAVFRLLIASNAVVEGQIRRRALPKAAAAPYAAWLHRR